MHDDNVSTEQQVTEEIDIVTYSPASVLILEAMLFEIGADEDLQKSFGMNGSKAAVSMTVNGRSVPVIKSLEDAWRRCDAEIEARARKIALRMVTEAGLDPIAAAIRDAETSIRTALQNWDGARE